MRAAGIRALGEPVEILEVDELPPPGADEVLIDVAAAGVGNSDELVRIGSWRIGGSVPMALGTEAAGTVAAAGSGVAEVGEGHEVITHPLPLRRHGTWAGRVLAPAATVAARPRVGRGVAVSDVCVRPDGRQLSALAELLARGALSVPIASVRPLEQAAQALREVVAGADGAVVLSLRA